MKSHQQKQLEAIQLIELHHQSQIMECSVPNPMKEVAMTHFILTRLNSKVNKKVKIDFFATSLPILLVFDDNLQKRNEWEAKYLIALAEKGLGNLDLATKMANEILNLNTMHLGAKELISN